MAIAARQIPSLRTFTIGFAEANYDERPFAAVVAQHIGAQHVDCTMSVADVLECLPRLVWEYGQPFGDNSAVATYLVHQLAKEDVTVVLTGDGGDEAFGGYWRALAARYAELYRRCIPAVIRRNVLPNAMSLLDRVGCETLAARWRRLEQQTNDSCGSPYTNALSWYELRPHALGSALKPIASNHVPADCFRRQQDQGEAIPLMESAMRADYATQLADCFLVKTDVAGMAAAVETRAPMLAHEIVELAWRLPDSLKVRVLGGTKWLLKRITAGYVPSKVVFRRKQGFSLPLDVWFRGKLGDVLSTLIIDSRLARWNLLDTAAMKRVLMEHISGRKNHEIRLWLMLWLELWFRICIETEIDPTESLA
jgi:asparagine synthase (glutamine-hydrolysing)